MRSHGPGALRATLRFIASVMVVSGLLLIADAGVTLLWQEPVSAFVADREQGQLEDALVTPPQRVVERRPLPGDAIGEIEIPTISLAAFVVEGTDTENLRKGPGHYPDSPLPGQRGTVAIAGHRTTYGAPFRRLNELERGERIVLDMPYGHFVYRIQQIKIVDDEDLSVLEPVGHDQLVLTACHPLYSATQRIVAFARLTHRDRARVKRS